MPFLHRYLGNPVLSFLGSAVLLGPVGDFHAACAAFAAERILALDLRTTGMEFATEMVVRAALAGYVIAEVPTTLRRTALRAAAFAHVSDGWRHLRSC